MKGWKLVLAIAATMLVPATSPATEPKPVPVEQLVKSPPLKLRRVLVLGQVDNCSGFTCNLCPAGMTRDAVDWRRCLSLSFEGFREGGRPVDVSSYMERAFRFATVILDADYDPTCLTSKEIVCVDRAPVIINAKVVKVLSRKMAKDGLVTDYADFGALVEPGEGDRIEMGKVAMTNFPIEEQERLKLFLVRDYPYLDNNRIAVGLGCFCDEDSCADAWPQRYFLGFDSPANPFHCIDLEKHTDGWRIFR